MEQKRATLMAVILAALTIMVSACGKGEGRADDMTASSITAYNHTPDYIHQFYINDAWGGNSFAYGGGGGFVCCVIYPRKWHQGLTATVRWTTSSSDPNETGDAAVGKWHEAIVPIEKYLEPGTVQIHFLPEGKIRIIISNLMSGHPDYPGPDYPVMPPDFHFEPWRGAASEAEARARSREARRALQVSPDDSPSLPPDLMPLYPKERQ
ncbi:conserved exported hypothetical protein [Cupriavidus taiwanensis]|uniref:DUF3304 domain-containing protein n=1 Tax=Cupriavidus taiwanensis TaxID=164546 RepID=UPI000E1342C2|nr:DUF3304 domain-containing protein [Cupriavidus taiwanensis]SPA02846.1 conserved exported hypothetical protein [Cupriavidus taiwanensis]